MPTNKNAILRYKYLDDLLSDCHHYYSIRDLWEKCNERLIANGFSEVSLRWLQKDAFETWFSDEPFETAINVIKEKSEKVINNLHINDIFIEVDNTDLKTEPIYKISQEYSKRILQLYNV